MVGQIARGTSSVLVVRVRKDKNWAKKYDLVMDQIASFPLTGAKPSNKSLSFSPAVNEQSPPLERIWLIRPCEIPDFSAISNWETPSSDSFLIISCVSMSTIISYLIINVNSSLIFILLIF